MRIALLLILHVLFFLSYGLVQAQVSLSEHIYSPDNGVICDDKAGFCVDSYGISMAFTKEYLGQEAQDKMMKLINDVGSENFDTTRYSLSNKVYCDSETKQCLEDRFSDIQATEYNDILFHD
ncbi:YcgJ family protein [Photobacterium minamisatsumaniensis]|uniref:YcgJ family protein n=1 Tax=Photobacterium minamisatsumaniensis TaxID=2910233 RepID=UPI003D0C5FFE